MFYQLEHIGSLEPLQIEQGENFNYPQHLHQCFELIYVDEGEMTVTVNDVAYPLKKGEAVFIFPHQLHALSSTHSKHTLFIFSTHVVQTYYSDFADKVPRNSRFTLSPQSLYLLKNLCAKSPLYQIKGALYTACAEFHEQTEYCDANSDKENTLSKILFYIEENFKAACTVQDIAEGIHYNAEYVSRFFKSKMGFSCNFYVNKRRLHYAAYLLSNTNASCLCCAMESGFTSLRSFNRKFKEHFGISPSEYKKQKGLA